MKTFSDLNFEPHAIARKESPGAEIAKIKLTDGSISVIRGSERFQSGQSTYEVAIYRGTNLDEVRGYQTSAQITEIMKELQ